MNNSVSVCQNETRRFIILKTLQHLTLFSATRLQPMANVTQVPSKPGVIFTTLHFLHNLSMGPI